MQNFMGMDGFVWFTGVVEDRDDPSKLGRVRVRCVGYHTEDKNRIPTEDLPCAHVMHPVTDPSMGGMGMTPSFMVEGTWVVGFFMDAEDKQQPVIIGTLPGVPDGTPETSKGFNDPNGIYPKSTRVNESDVNRLARSDSLYLHEMQIKKSQHRINTDTEVGNGFTSIPVAGGSPFSEKVSPYAARYPFNHVFETESGHIKEFDDTAGEERIHEYHTSGTYNEVAGSGTRTVKIVGDGYHIIAGSDYAYVDGHCNLTIGSNCSTYVKGNYDLRVDGNMEILVKGNKRETILCNDDTEEGFVEQIIKSGKKQTAVDGEVIEVYGDKFSTDVKVKVTEIFAGGLQTNITGTYNLDVGDDPVDAENLGKILINTPTIETEVTTFSLDATTSNITATTFNLDSSTSANIKSAIINMDGAEIDIDATNYQLNATESNLPKITVGAADAHALLPSVTSPSSADVTLPTIANELLLTPLLTPLVITNRLAELKTETGASFTNEQYADAILRAREAEKKEGRDPDLNDGTERGGDAPVGNSIFTGTNAAALTGYDPNLNYNDPNTPNSSPYIPYTSQYLYDEEGLLRFFDPKYNRNTDPRINPKLGSIAERLVKSVRTKWGKPDYVATIISGFRTPSANEISSGVKGSQHKQGNAIDILMDNIPRENQKIFIDEAINLGITGVGSYFQSNSGREFFHLDVGPKRHWGPDTSYLSQYAFMLPILRKYSFPSTSIAGKTTTTKKTLSRA